MIQWPPRNSSTATTPLRLALFIPCDPDQMPVWMGQAAQDLNDCNYAAIELLFVAEAPGESYGVAFQLYRRLLGSSSLLGAKDPSATAAFASRLPSPRTSLSGADLREHKIDLLIALFTPDWDSEALVLCTRLGLLWLHFGDLTRYSGNPRYFWESVRNDPVSALSLVAQPPGRPPCLAAESFCSTERHLYTAANAVGPLWSASWLIQSYLWRLHQGGAQRTVCHENPPLPLSKVAVDAPSGGTLVRWIAPALATKAKRRLRREPPLRNEWRVAFRWGGDIIQNGTQPDLRGFQFLQTPPGRFYADPFPVQRDNTMWLFFEDYVYADRKAVLSCGQLTRSGELVDTRIILDRPFHLSYPMVFQHGGRWYMIPESNANDTMDLYEATRFPWEWRRVKTLFSGKATDPAIWFEDGLIWLFFTAIEPYGRCHSLVLFSSDSLDGDWTPHPDNPLSMDIRNARGAGAILRHNGRLYRPSQDCSWRYGYAFWLNEIVTLDRRHYQERKRIAVGPDWSEGIVGTHTYNRAGELEVVDANWYIPDRQSR